jgi:hypothetical protein
MASPLVNRFAISPQSLALDLLNIFRPKSHGPAKANTWKDSLKYPGPYGQGTHAQESGDLFGFEQWFFLHSLTSNNSSAKG